MAHVGPEDLPSITLGYSRVDAQPEPSLMVAGMDATAQWRAVRQLRDWEAEHLALQPGEWLIDVGCGPGDAAIALSAALAPDGFTLGIDSSEAMLEVARRRAEQAGVAVEFRVEDAQALTVGEGEMDACRSERMLQWIPDSGRALKEMVRVLRPGGRLVVADTDWRTLAFDLPDQELVDTVAGAIGAFRGPGHTVGGRLLNMCRDLGLVDVDCTAATHVWTEWDPDAETAPSGFFPFSSALSQLADLGMVSRDTGERFNAIIEDAARRDRFCMSLTMFAVYGSKPDPAR